MRQLLKTALKNGTAWYRIELKICHRKTFVLTDLSAVLMFVDNSGSIAGEYVACNHRTLLFVTVQFLSVELLLDLDKVMATEFCMNWFLKSKCFMQIHP